jgi:outer membrane protein OmpA-like peptidoglycan-associated protein
MGQASVVAQKPEQAQRQWILGLQSGPRIEEYVVGGMSEETFVPLELVTELAWLQFRYPNLDPTGTKFKLFIDLLFKGKAEAYRARDLRAIQRHHTVLGEIFAAKGIWQSDWADNAIFQLSHAIDVAERRQQDEGLYQPLPGLKARLAEGYDIVGKPDLAQITAIDAAQAYLDSDRLDKASAWLKRARPTAAPANERARIDTLQEILVYRQAIEGAVLAADEGGETDGVLTAERIERGIQNLPGLPADFLVRQQFKIDADLTELGLKVPGLLVPEDRADKALFWARKVPTLVGMGDVLRLERVATMAAADKGKTGQLAVQILAAPPSLSEPADAWLLAMPSGGRLSYAAITSDVTAETPDAGPWLVFFGHDSAALLPEAHRMLSRIANEVSGAGSTSTLRLVGRSDTMGAPAYNLELSQRRASSVASYLVRLGIDRDRIERQGVGESRLAVPTADETPLPGNRVVEIMLD